MIRHRLYQRMMSVIVDLGNTVIIRAVAVAVVVLDVSWDLTDDFTQASGNAKLTV